MRGNIQQRGTKSWRIKVYVGRDDTGRKRYVHQTVNGTRKDAERELSRLLVAGDEGRVAAGPSLSFDDLLDRWLAVKRQAVEPSTMQNYEWVARKYIRPALGSRRVASLRALDLDMLYSSLSEQGLSPRTVRICHTVLRQSLEQARRWGLIAHSPAIDATPPPQRREEVTPPTVDQVLTILSAAHDEDPDFGAYLWVKSATECRRGEVCALRWSDFDLDRAELAVRRSVVVLGQELREKDTKTHQSRRIALDEATISVLRQHRLHQREQMLALGAGLADDALLFGSPEGRPWRPDVVTNRFGRLRATLDLQHVRLHDLRHFVASVLIDGGIPISTVSSRLGHSQISTTLNLYTHALPATDQKAAAYMGDVLTRPRPRPTADGSSPVRPIR